MFVIGIISICINRLSHMLKNIGIMGQAKEKLIKIQERRYGESDKC